MWEAIVTFININTLPLVYVWRMQTDKFRCACYISLSLSQIVMSQAGFAKGLIIYKASIVSRAVILRNIISLPYPSECLNNMHNKKNKRTVVDIQGLG